MNADDVGYDRPSTDKAADCFARGRITSASAMVYMRDSDRAASVVREAGIPVGLHLNLSEAYTSGDAPPAARERQERLAGRFRGSRLRLRRWLYDPTIRRDVDACIADQLERFDALYGRPPAHVDGHQHVQVSPNVLLSPALRPGIGMRTALLSDGSLPARAARAARRRLLVRRFASTDYCLDFSERARGLELARNASVELVAHPALRDLEGLLSEDWGRALDGVRLGSYVELSRTHRR